MNRLQKFREMRLLRIKLFGAIIMFVTLLTCGIIISDYSLNGIINNDNRVKIVSAKSNGDFIEINIMNLKAYLNIKYLERDMGRMKSAVWSFFKRRS